MACKNVILWEGPGEYVPIPSARPGRWFWCLALNAFAGITLRNEEHAARLGRVIPMR